MMSIHHYFKSFSDLERIIRGAGRFKFQEHNVASHSFKVVKYCQFFGTVEEQNGIAIDWKILYEKAVNHDYAEVLLGDIKTPVKYATPELRQILHHVEEQMMEQFIQQEIPSEFQAQYRLRFAEGKDESIEGRILALADKTDLLYEAYDEIAIGNPDRVFIAMFTDAVQVIAQSDLHSAHYMMNFVIPVMVEEQGEDSEIARLIRQYASE
ncbi:MAG: YfbR-like 5'-deoxynucleotidase [Bacilli bacterium]